MLYHMYRSVSRGRRPAFGERFGRVPPAALAKIGKRPVIWLHAVSVGESIAARPLLKELRRRYPAHAILISNTTETGRSISSTFNEKDTCIYFPFDFVPAVRRALEQIKPKLVIIMETEIWPNFTREATRRDIPVILANGRISDRSFDRYLKFRYFFRQSLQMFSNLCMQSDTDVERIIAIGAQRELTLATGNLKYDINLRTKDDETKRQLRDKYGIPEGVIALTAGSTHPGEEQYVISMYREQTKTTGNLFLILVPRHPERSAEVAALLKASGLVFRRRTELSGTDAFEPGEVLLVDTVGEMMDIYTLSDVAFVGGSLVPTGGHNLLEPASAGIPCIFGPNMNNFREITELVLHYGAGIQIESPEGLEATMKTLVTSPELRRVLGQNGMKMIRDNGGATERHMEVISRYL